MGFDNECIVNIQSLAGEYFCPVCRLLVYPNEAMQSQCTHLYCKPCLTYVVGTTRACPYDGYLVTEPESKPLLESNKALADTIGKIAVRCLYHRSGCQWQGPLSDCTTHCSGCAYGNSAVVCNRCAVQIVHRQVQEHAQTCPGVQPQATQAEGTQNVVAAVAAAPANGGQGHAATQPVATNSVANTPQTGATPATAQDPNLQASVNPLVNGVAQGAVLTPEQLYQQQYYQQYPGYDPYQQAYQNYYPYPQQPQAYLQPQQAQQPAIQSQAPVQAQAPPQSQGQAQPHSLQNVNPNYQTQQAAQPPAQMMPQGQQPLQGYPQPYPQLQSHAQSYPGGQTHQQPPPTHPQSQQIPQFPQPQPQVQQHHPQMPPQSYSQAHPQHQNIPQQPHPPHQSMSQALNPNAQPQTQQPLHHAVMGNHSYPQPQAHQQMPIGAQQRPNLHPQGGPIPQLPPHPQGQHAQQFPPMGVPQPLPPVQTQQLAPHGQVPGVPPAQQRPANPYGQQLGHLAMHPIQLMPQQHMPHQQAFSGQASGPVQNQPHSHSQHMQLPPPPPLHPELHHQLHSGLQPQQPQSHYARPVMGNHEAQPHAFAQPAAGFPGQAQGRPAHLGANQHLPSHNPQLRTSNQFQTNDSSSQGIAEKERSGLASASGLGTESVEVNNLKVEGDIKSGDKEDELRRAENTSELPARSGGKSFEQKDDTDASQKEKLTVGDKSNEGGANTGVQVVETAHTSEGSANHEERKPAQSHVQNGSAPPSHPFPPAEQIWGHHLPMQYPPAHQQRPAGPPMLQQALPPGLPHYPQPFNMHPDHVQPPPFGRPPSHFVPHDRSFELQHSRGPRMPSTFPDPRSRYLDGPSPGTKSQVRNSKDSVDTDASLTAGMQDERFNPLTDRVPRPFDKEPGSGALDASRFLPPYHIGGLNEAGNRVPGFGGNHIDRFVSRSPGRENAGFPSRDFGGLPGFPRNQSGMRNFEGHESRPFDEGPRPFGHFQRGDQLEGPRFLRGGEFQDPRKLPAHMHVGDPTGFGAFPAPGHRGDLTSPENFPRHRPFSEPFSGNISGHLNFGEPGFRSSYPVAGGLDPFDNLRKRLPPNNGWCRICKVECEGVEGLELHSQTREHQDMAMDMVRNIKLQNSKKLKLSSDPSPLKEPSKRRGPGYEVQNSRR